ncbi:hypothetical protein HN587_00775 [Candidatus Woesearchaeota archaeon]|jgi:hypothetical protein|nr:hypothetical protein [Candidatus Woesearchaeota archaeon]
MKFLMQNKRGITQTDWVISLGIFLVYLFWFFVFITPFMSTERNTDTVLQIVQDNLEKEIFQIHYSLPIYFHENVSNSYEPIILDNYPGINSTNAVFNSGYYEVDENRLLFLANTSRHSYDLVWPIYSGKLKQPSSVKPMVSGDTVNSGGMSVRFENHQFYSIFYKDALRVQGLGIWVDGYEDEVVTGVRGNTSLVFKETRFGELMDADFYIFGKNSRIYSFINVTDYKIHDLTFAFNLHNYTRVYQEGLPGQLIDYEIEICREFEGDNIHFSDATTGLSFFLGVNSTFLVCANQTQLNITIDFELVNETWFNIFLHQLNGEIVNYPIVPYYGMKSQQYLISKQKVEQLAGFTYPELKSLFGYPAKRDFNISFEGDYYTKSIGIPITEMYTDIYSKKLNKKSFNDDLTMEDFVVNMRIW